MDHNDLIFWTGILADHGQFLLNAFSPQEVPYIQEARMFHFIFQKYNATAKSGTDVNSIESLKNDVMRFIEFKKKIVTELLACNLLIHFSPGFVNHMVNEANEFLDLINVDTCPEKTQKPATYIKIWIADASGHTAAMIASLDGAEALLHDNVMYFQTKFDKIYKKSAESEMIQENLGRYNDYVLLKAETIDVLNQFVSFCKELVPLIDGCNILKTGTFDSVIVNHFIREHEYVISKLTTCVS